MALLPRLRQLMRRPTSASRVGARRPTNAERRGDTLHEDALRSMLSDDPNNERAFSALAEIVRRRASQAYEAEHDPLTAPGGEQERQRAANLAVWSLAEELAGNPRAWYPLVELARLSMDDDHEGGLRRLVTAAERDPSGRALVAGIELLRQSGQPGEGLNLGVGHWRIREQMPDVGVQVVRAAIEAGRPLEARQHLAALASHPDQLTVGPLVSALEHELAQVEHSVPGT